MQVWRKAEEENMRGKEGTQGERVQDRAPLPTWSPEGISRDELVPTRSLPEVK